MSKATDTLTYLEIAGIAVVAFITYKTASKVASGAVSAAEAVKEVVTKDLNPASTENVIYKNLPQGFKDTLQSGLEKVFGKIPDYSSAPHNVAPVVAPTQNTPNESAAETARLVKASSATGQNAIAYKDNNGTIQSIPYMFGVNIQDQQNW